MDLIFKALADPSRRELLDRLYANNGQTLKRLCVDLSMTRQAITKHLAVLEAANLVKISWNGREKLHFLNLSPLQLISSRWLDKYESPQPRANRPITHATRGSAETEGENHWADLHKFDLTVL